MRTTLSVLLFAFLLALALAVPAQAAQHHAAPAKASSSAAQAVPATDTQEGIVAVVNQDAISRRDLYDRTRLLIVSSGLPNTPDIKAKIAAQAMNGLIEEQLMLQEAKKQNIDIDDKEIDAGFAQLAQQNKILPEQFKEMISRSGVNIATMRRQIRAQLGWSKVIQKVMRPQIEITEGDIDQYVAQMAANKGKTEYLLAEIFLPVDAPNQDAPARQLADKLVSEMRAGRAPFFKVAQQFSKAPGAEQGGDRGWIQAGQLPDELDSVMTGLAKNSISDPIHTARGYHILYVRDTRSISDETMPPRDKVMTMIGLSRLDRMQRRYLMDLRSSAFIENRAKG